MTASPPPLTRIGAGERYSQAVKAGTELHIGGQLAYATRGGDIGAQTEEILGRIDHYLTEAGLVRTDLVMVQVYFDRREDYDGFNAVWDRWVPAGAPPARLCVVAPLIWDGYRIEVTARASTARGAP